MTTLDIGVDVDNVVYPWSTVVTRWCERRKGMLPGTLDDHALSWNFPQDQWGMGKDEFRDHFLSGIRAGVIFATGDPTPGSVSALRRLHALGHRLHFVTDRVIAGDAAYDVTHRWLHDAGYPVDSITITANKSDVDTDVFLDDGAHNIQALIDARHPWPIVWDRPHNRDHLFAGRQPIRAHDWHGFVRVVDGVSQLTPKYSMTKAGDHAAPTLKDAA